MDSLFDDPDPPEPEAPADDWHEAPQALFLSWSRKQQLLYCAARDADSAMRAESLEEIEWYLARSKAYKEDAERL